MFNDGEKMSQCDKAREGCKHYSPLSSLCNGKPADRIPRHGRKGCEHYHKTPEATQPTSSAGKSPDVTEPYKMGHANTLPNEQLSRPISEIPSGTVITGYFRRVQVTIVYE